MIEETIMDKITTEMAEHICDKICSFPREMIEEELYEHCCDCKMGQYICSIINEYNRINDFSRSQIYKLLDKNAELELKLAGGE